MTNPLITNIEIGDIFVSKKEDLCNLLVGGRNINSLYQFIGFCGLGAFNIKGDNSDFTFNEAINHLNKNNFYWAGNINQKIIDSLNLAESKMKEKWAAEKPKKVKFPWLKKIRP